MTSTSYHKKHIWKDFYILILSIVCTVILVKTGALNMVAYSTTNLGILGIVIVGIFFTSIFTITPAGVVLGYLVQSESLLQVAVFGAIGAVIGDVLIYLYLKDTLASDILYLMKKNKNKVLRHFFHLRIWRWLTPLLGAIIIASPLPDELGLAMMGISKMRTILLIPISFTFNVIAIALIASAIGQM
ncbi:MAG: hypothetical protein NUV47_01025 [Patescibacteria group bacterium]|nr:hypothetical protein [Patescibacteria group bacterium]